MLKHLKKLGTIFFLVLFGNLSLAKGQIAKEAASYMVVDKLNAFVFVYSANGELIGKAPALVGQTLGDADSPVPGNKKLTDFKPNERITPAGRFKLTAGLDLKGNHVLWFNYNSMLAIHSVQSGPTYLNRIEKLKKNSPKDRRLTLGCVVVEHDFFEKVIMPVLSKSDSFVYILPEKEGFKT